MVGIARPRMMLPAEAIFLVILIDWSLVTRSIARQDENVSWLPEDYDKLVCPAMIEALNQSIVTVKVNLVSFGITRIVEEEMEFQIDMRIKIQWNDERLKDKEGKRLSSQKFAVQLEQAQRLWRPLTIFSNCKACDTEAVASDFSLNKEMKVNLNTSAVRLSYRKTMDFICNYDLQSYPMDIHECNIFITVKSGVMSELEKLEIKPYIKNNEQDEMMKERIPPRFKYLSSSVENKCEELAGGNERHCLKYSFRFQRIISHYMMTVYVPSFLIVIVSWISFWIGIEGVPARIALGLTSLLTLATQFSSQQEDLPPVSYVKALDVWMITCVVMVFLSMIEFACANSYHGRKCTKTVYKISPLCEAIKGTKCCLSCVCPIAPCKVIPVNENQDVNPFDMMAKIVFPCMFLLFNIVYWSYYL